MHCSTERHYSNSAFLSQKREEVNCRCNFQVIKKSMYKYFSCGFQRGGKAAEVLEGVTALFAAHKKICDRTLSVVEGLSLKVPHLQPSRTSLRFIGKPGEGGSEDICFHTTDVCLVLFLPQFKCHTGMTGHHITKNLRPFILWVAAEQPFPAAPPPLHDHSCQSTPDTSHKVLKCVFLCPRCKSLACTAGYWA